MHAKAFCETAVSLLMPRLALSWQRWRRHKGKNVWIICEHDYNTCKCSDFTSPRSVEYRVES